MTESDALHCARRLLMFHSAVLLAALFSSQRRSSHDDMTCQSLLGMCDTRIHQQYDLEAAMNDVMLEDENFSFVPRSAPNWLIMPATCWTRLAPATSRHSSLLSCLGQRVLTACAQASEGDEMSQGVCRQCF